MRSALKCGANWAAGRAPSNVPAGTSGRVDAGSAGASAAASARANMVTEIKQELQNEMGLLPVHLLRERRSSFVELYSTDTLGKTNYGTAGYLGHGYFITVKHAVVALRRRGRAGGAAQDRLGADHVPAARRFRRRSSTPATPTSRCTAATGRSSGRASSICPALHVDTAFSYDFAEPIFRLGNDYSKGIILSTGYVGQRTSNGLVTCLTDGHPGVSGGGVLDQRGDLVGIPIGRMQGDYRFSFILPLRAEMLRKVPAYEPAEPPRRGRAVRRAAVSMGRLARPRLGSWRPLRPRCRTCRTRSAAW